MLFPLPVSQAVSDGEKLETAMQRLLLTDASVEVAQPRTLEMKRGFWGFVCSSGTFGHKRLRDRGFGSEGRN